WSKVARGLSFVGAPTQPYHPDPERPEQPGGSTLLEVPVTIRPHPLARAPLVGKLIEPRWLRPTRGSAAQIVGVATDAIAAARAESPDAPVVLNAMFHNVEIIPGASPYADRERHAQGILDRLCALLRFASNESIRMVGLSDVVGLAA